MKKYMSSLLLWFVTVLAWGQAAKAPSAPTTAPATTMVKVKMVSGSFSFTHSTSSTKAVTTSGTVIWCSPSAIPAASYAGDLEEGPFPKIPITIVATAGGSMAGCATTLTLTVSGITAANLHQQHIYTLRKFGNYVTGNSDPRFVVR